MENENALELQNNPTEGNTTEQERKLFSQEELNRILGERLAKERAKTEAEYAKREKELRQREFQLKAKEILAAKNMPEELMTALNCTDEETMAESVSTIEKYIKTRIEEQIKVTYEGNGFTPGVSSRDFVNDPIRKAMEL